MKINYPAPINIQNRYFCGYWKTDKDHSEEGESKIPINHLTSADALNQLVGYVKFINNTNGTVLYRGQGTEHGTLPPSGCRKTYTAISDEVISVIASLAATAILEMLTVVSAFASAFDLAVSASIFICARSKSVAKSLYSDAS